MQRDGNLLNINNGQHIDAIQMSYRKTGAVYTRRFGLLEVTPDRTPIRSRARIGSNSIDFGRWCLLFLFNFSSKI